MAHLLPIKFAAHDPALRSADGDYWAWRSPDVPARLFEEAYALIARYAHCDRPNSLTADDLWGGCAGLSRDWLVFYRFYDGGRDLDGRPERAILLLGVAPRSESLRYDCSEVLNQPPFSEWAARQPLVGCPDTSHESIMPTVTLLKVPVQTHTVPNSDRIADTAAPIKFLQDLWRAACRFPETEQFLMEFRHQNGRPEGRIILPRAGIAPVLPTKSQGSSTWTLPNRSLRSSPYESAQPSASRSNRSIFRSGLLPGIVGLFAGLALGLTVGDRFRNWFSGSSTADVDRIIHWAENYQKSEIRTTHPARGARLAMQEQRLEA